MIKQLGSLFILNTEKSTYAFKVTGSGHLEHLYYGTSLGNIDERDAESMSEKREFELGNAIVLDKENPLVLLEDMCLEMSGPGKGDCREPFAELIFADGSRTVDFRYDRAEIKAVSPEISINNIFSGMPFAYDETGTAERLIITLTEASKPVRMELIYDVFPECDVICRHTRIYNEGTEPVTIARLMSTQLDFARTDLVLRGFYGAWAREMQPVDVPVNAGRHTISSALGVSSSNANPFCMLYEEGATESAGLCYGLNLVYSGNHYESAEVSAFGKTRFVSGINPQGFSWLLGPGEEFITPQAVMTVSGGGFTGMSIAMHAFVREHIVRGEWKRKARPVLLNSWEAAYFDINEKKLLNLAAKAAKAGIELFVMDDGWFGNRNDASSSLGDWTPNKKKLPGGVAGICKKVNALGMDFGIWVEPEMVNVDSDLYRAHPDWAMDIPERQHSEGRNQRLLDFANDEVVEYMTEQMSNLFSSADIAYVKWDHNRVFSDVYSRALPAERQGETAHRYMLGVYRMMKTLMERFPHILFEGCASGGNRFDLGILSYFPQIWASDNTDAVCRASMQEGYSYGYPQSVVGAHVSGCPNHQTLRETPLDTRYNVAAFGVLGYELNMVDLSDRDFAAVKGQIERYKEWREVLQFGQFYRTGATGTGAKPAWVNSGRVGSAGPDGNGSFTGSPVRSWTCVAPDGKTAVGMIMQILVTPDSQLAIYRAGGLLPDCRYHLYNVPQEIDLMHFGDLINTQLPVHIKPGSFSHRTIAKYKTMPGEQEEHNVLGSVLMSQGIKLRPAFCGTGYSDKVRYFQDFSSRMYYLEVMEEE